MLEDSERDILEEIFYKIPVEIKQDLYIWIVNYCNNLEINNLGSEFCLGETEKKVTHKYLINNRYHLHRQAKGLSESLKIPYEAAIDRIIEH